MYDIFVVQEHCANYLLGPLRIIFSGNVTFNDGLYLERHVGEFDYYLSTQYPPFLPYSDRWMNNQLTLVAYISHFNPDAISDLS